MPILNVVTGAFDYTGQYITRKLLRRGSMVRTLTGHPMRFNPFGRDSVQAVPFNFDRPDVLTENLRGATVVFNTYWIRFEHGGLTFARAVQNIRQLIDCAVRAGIRRFVQISITNASTASQLPYFRGKGAIEEILRSCGLSYAIVRPTVIFGGEDILINNIAWALRTFPIFAVPGKGDYRLQPVFIEDLAALVTNVGQQSENIELDAVGPETFRFDELLRLLARSMEKTVRLVHVPSSIALLCASMIGRAMGDVILTADEIRGLQENLLVSRASPTAPTRLSDWLEHHAGHLGLLYASELAKRA